MFGRVQNTFLISTPQFKCNIRFSKERSERFERKQKRSELNERNARTWVRVLYFICSGQGAEATTCNIVMN